jgi:hypothetical protein
MDTALKKHILAVMIFVFILIFAHGEPVQAKVFRNSYVSFELPDKWDCYLENTAWICRYAISKSCLGPSSNSKACQEQRKKTREAIIILAAKEVGPKDSFNAYYDHLKKPRPIVMKEGKRSSSKIIHTKAINIAKHKWIDGMHLGSEIPHYYTRYLATIKGNIAVLVTFSAHKRFYTNYSNEFFRAIKSLRVIATKSSTVGKNELRPKGVGTLGVNIGAHLDTALDELGGEDYDDGSAGGFGSEMYFVLAALFLALLGVFIWFKGRR